MITAQQLREKYAYFNGDLEVFHKIEVDVLEAAENMNRLVYYSRRTDECSVIIANKNYFERLGYKIDEYALGVDLIW